MFVAKVCCSRNQGGRVEDWSLSVHVLIRAFHYSVRNFYRGKKIKIKYRVCNSSCRSAERGAALDIAQKTSMIRYGQIVFMEEAGKPEQ